MDPLGVVTVVAAAVLLAGFVVADRRRRAATESADSARAEAQVATARADEADAVLRRLALALDAVPEGVVVTDESGRPVYRNAVAATYRDARHADALVAAALDELVTAALVGRGDERVLELFGPPRRTLVVSATPLVADGGPAGALAVIEDVTERRRLDEVRRDFVANISHELKTPIGALSLLAETLVDEDDLDVIHRLAGRMVDETERVTDTIEDLLALTHIETESTQERAPVSVGAAMAEAVRRIEPAADRRGIPVRVSCPPTDVVVVGDRRQLVSALSNLLDNAVKYSEPGGVVEISAVAEGEHVAISVEDHGIGIPARDLDRVFERFYRVDSARSRRTGGTGLGLAIVRHVVSNHDGDVHVASRLGEGSTFTLRLPRRVDPNAPAPRGDAESNGARHTGDWRRRQSDRGDPGSANVETEQDGDQEHLGAGGGGRGLLHRGADHRVAT